MGYILPITNFTYNDYQKRVTVETENFHYVNKPYKVMLNMKHQALSKEKDNHNLVEETYRKNNLKFNQIVNKTNTHIRENEYELTGKGKVFNKYV